MKGCRIAVTVAVALLAGAALAQQTQRPITMVVPFPPAGSADQLARLTASNISSQSGRAVVVENKPGAGGYIGGEIGARGANDGSALVFTEFGTLFTSIFVKAQTTVVYRALTPLAGVAKSPLMLVFPSAMPARNLREFLSLVKASPGKYNAGVVNGAGTMLETIRFLKLANLDMVLIPYNDGGSVVTSILAGDNHLYLGSYALAKAHIDSKRLVALGLAGSERFSLAPDVPTIAEQGVNFESEGFFAVMGPASMPPDLVLQLNRSITAAMDNAATRATIRKIGFDPVLGTAAELSARLDSQSKDLFRAAAAVGIQPQ